MTKNLSKARLMAAHIERSLIQSGYLYIGRFEYNDILVVAYRNPRSTKRAKIEWTFNHVSLYINGKLVEYNKV